jgi:hypothetical protein
VAFPRAPPNTVVVNCTEWQAVAGRFIFCIRASIVAVAPPAQNPPLISTGKASMRQIGVPSECPVTATERFLGSRAPVLHHLDDVRSQYIKISLGAPGKSVVLRSVNPNCLSFTIERLHENCQHNIIIIMMSIVRSHSHSHADTVDSLYWGTRETPVKLARLHNLKTIDTLISGFSFYLRGSR